MPFIWSLIVTQELENLKIYPVEVLAGQLYMGDQQQGADLEILKDLKITAVVNISESDAQEEWGNIWPFEVSMLWAESSLDISFWNRTQEENQNVLIIPVAESVFSDLFSHLEKICNFIGELFPYC